MASRLGGVLLVLAALCVLPLSAAQHRQFYRWTPPELEGDLIRRQLPPPGYHPEFGTCGSGTTCENACGPDWLSCKASTDLSLFCYNKVQLNQTCCGNGSGRACDNGFYCAWNTFGGKVWCCKNGQSLEECGVDPLPSSSSSSITSSTTPPPDSNSIPTITKTTTTTTTEIRGTDGTYTTTTTEFRGTDGTFTTTTTRTVEGPTVTTTTTTGAATVTSVSTTTVGAATATVTTTTTVGTATSIITVTEPAITQTVSVTVFTNVPSGVSIITSYSTISVTLTTGCNSGYPSWTKDHPGYPTDKPGYPGTDKDWDHYTEGGEKNPPHTGGPYDPPKLAVTGNTTTEPSAVVTGGAGRMNAAVGGLVVVVVGVMLF